jgi:hypothetical protein
VQVWPDAGGTPYVWCFERGGRAWACVPGLAAYRLDERQATVTAFANHGHREAADARPPVAPAIAEVYARVVRPLFVQRCGLEVLHAGALLTPRGVVGWCGRTGSGKSTIAFGLGRRGRAVWADDVLAWRVAGREVEALALPFHVRLRPPASAFFGRAGSGVCSPRAVDAVSGSAPLAALALLQPTEGTAVVETRQVPSSQAFLALLDHAFCFSLLDQDRKARMIASYLTLCTRVPVCEIRYPPGFDRFDALLDAIEALGM